MNKHVNEPDFIGGQGSLTKEEELALSTYFSRKKKREEKPAKATSLKKKSTASLQER